VRHYRRICSDVRDPPATKGALLTTQQGEQVFGSSPGQGSPTERTSTLNTEQRLDHILEIATVCIARDGYTKASMRTIAAAAGISLAGLYHYFENKEKMLFLIQFRSFSALLRRLQERLHGIKSPEDRLRVAVLAHVMHYAHDKPALRLCAHEFDTLTGQAHEEVARLRHQIYDILRAIVDRLLEECAHNSSLNAHVATMSLFGSLNWLYQWYDPREDRSPAGLAQLISDQFLGGLLGAGAPADHPLQHNGPPH